MFSARSPLPGTGASRPLRFEGLFFDDFATDSAWLRERGILRLPPMQGPLSLMLEGEFRPHPQARGLEVSAPSLVCRVDGAVVGRTSKSPPGEFKFEFELTPESLINGAEITLQLSGTAVTNTLAWLGRITGYGPWQRFRAQNKNRQLRIRRLRTREGETIFDFTSRLAPFSGFARRHTRYEMNIIGFLTADLGVAESARCMIRAADAAKITSALVPLKLNCKNRLGDLTYADRLQEANPYRTNVIHLDAPASRDIDHHHGPNFRAGKYNIAYWAWELPEFPDAWVPDFRYFDEVWCPSDFTREAIAMKSPLPVITMPHSISFERPVGNFRARFGLPHDAFLFLFLYDLNSYSARKNPEAVVNAFRAAGLAGKGAALVIKVQNAKENPADFAALNEAVRDLSGTTLITETLSRREIYELESACDCFVSLHRAEGFGLAVAECMYLGKPAISTDWSATAEYVTPETGCPVHCRLVEIERSHGPYTKGQLWAEPDVAHAAEWMNRLFADRALAQTLGAAGLQAIEKKFAPAVIGARYRQRLESIATF